MYSLMSMPGTKPLVYVDAVSVTMRKNKFLLVMSVHADQILPGLDLFSNIKLRYKNVLAGDKNCSLGSLIIGKISENNLVGFSS